MAEAEATFQIEPGIQEQLGQKHSKTALLVVVLAYLAVWGGTRAHFMADTNVYTQAILRHEYAGVDTADYRLKTGNPFWDFGHILWRPSGWACFLLTQPATGWVTHQNRRAEVLLTLFGINFLASVAGVVLFFLLARRILKDEWRAVLTTIGFFSADALLDYAHSGNAYVPGLACLVGGMYFLWSDEAADHATVHALAGGILLALSVLLWLPYIFVLPAVMVGSILLYGHEKQRRLIICTIMTCAIVGLGVYGAAVFLVGVRNFTDLREWILASGHGHIQPGGFRAVARLAFSVPRSFINMDRDGMWLKRFLVHDPYARVTIRSLFALSLWKLVVFYAAAAVTLVELLRSRTGRILLAVLASSVLPILFFAVVIFEAGSIERYLPLYPFVFLAFGYVLASKQANRASKAVLLVALIAMAVTNINAMRPGTLQARKEAAIVRIHDLVPMLGPSSLVLAVNEQDSLAEFRQNFPLDALNVDIHWRLYDVLEINTERLATWRADLAQRVLETWQQGGTVWLPERFMHAQPQAEWNWVEGDDKRIHWTDLPAFFSQFDTGPTVGGEDGFLLWQDTPHNQGILESIIQGAGKK